MIKKFSAKRQVWNYSYLAYVFPILIGLIFIFLSVGQPYREGGLLLRLTIIIPEIIIWLIASISAFHFKQYANSIRTDKDGKGLDQIANALLLLVLYIVLLTTAGTIVRQLSGTPYLYAAALIRNHIPVMIALASAMMLLIGSSHLNKLVGQYVWTRKRNVLLALSALLFFIVFAWIFFSAQPNLAADDGIPRFVLPAQFLLFTYILPHVVLWFIGFKACLNLFSYATKAPGTIYKSLFKDLYRGIVLTFACIFMAQFLIITSTSSIRSNFAQAVIYILLVVALAGFILILKGSRKLDKIEGGK